VTGAAASNRPACTGTGVCAGSCDGEHADCQFTATSTVCAPSVCSDAVATAQSFCDGEGSCKAGAQTTCEDGCNGDACARSSNAKKGGCASEGADELAAVWAAIILLARRRSRAGPRSLRLVDGGVTRRG
jgi:hypothetical protein